METDARKPMAPTGPGRYSLRDGQIVTIFYKEDGFWHGTSGTCDEQGRHDSAFHRFDVIAYATDHSAWCLARARELCPPTHRVVPGDAQHPENLEAEAQHKRDIIKSMLSSCIPGGNLCDPQIIAENIREWFGKVRLEMKKFFSSIGFSIFSLVFVPLDYAAFLTTDLHWREHTFLFLLPGGGFVAYFTEPRTK